MSQFSQSHTQQQLHIQQQANLSEVSFTPNESPSHEGTFQRAGLETIAHNTAVGLTDSDPELQARVIASSIETIQSSMPLSSLVGYAELPKGVRAEFETLRKNALETAISNCLEIGTDEAYDAASLTMNRRFAAVRDIGPNATPEAYSAGRQLVDAGPEGVQSIIRGLYERRFSTSGREVALESLEYAARKGIEGEALLSFVSEPLSNFERYVSSEEKTGHTLQSLVSISARVFENRPDLLESAEGKEIVHSIARMTFSLPYVNGGGPSTEAMRLLERYPSETIDALAKDGLVRPKNGSASDRAFEYLSKRLGEEELVPVLSRALTSDGHYRAGYHQMLSRLNDIDPDAARSTARAMQFRSSSVFSLSGWKDTVKAFLDVDYAMHVAGRKEAADELLQGRLAESPMLGGLPKDPIEGPLPKNI